jgi:mono/diheme cytochrome c family protein
MPLRLAILIPLAITLMGCQRGSVAYEAVSRCYPEGACDEAMFEGGLKGGVADLKVGASLFQMHCASCHGVQGKGLEKTKRHDFTSPIWHASRKDLDIADAILRGRAPMMPPIALSESQLRDVIGHVRALKTATPSSSRPSGSGY